MTNIDNNNSEVFRTILEKQLTEETNEFFILIFFL